MREASSQKKAGGQVFTLAQLQESDEALSKHFMSSQENDEISHMLFKDDADSELPASKLIRGKKTINSRTPQKAVLLEPQQPVGKPSMSSLQLLLKSIAKCIGVQKN